ncbi:MAG: AAA family ATPase [Candidatus Aenigmarchaeota archaeon]|nr:AAA family ATPase [Candidatus Aenigmarchaeota archaeon]
MLTKKYEPRSVDEMIANREHARSIVAYIKSWKRGQCLMVHGPAGCGKTLAVRLAARAVNAELVESYASDDRSAGGAQSVVQASSQQSLVRRGKIISIEDAETLDSAKALGEIISKSSCPVIIVTGDPYSRKLQGVRKSCVLLAFQKARSDSIARFLTHVRDAEKMACSDAAISLISHSAGGDVRAALNDLQSAGDVRDSREDIFNTLKIIFKTLNMENVNMALKNSSKSVDEVLLWLEYNIAEEYEKPDEIARAYDWLSKADITSSRIIRRQAWALMKQKSVAVAGVALSKSNMYRKFSRYSFPRLQRAKQGFPLLSRMTHVSERRLREYSSLLSAMKKRRMLPEDVREEADALLG